jgi:deoxyadenosine/deoxycytidine kinase
MAYIVCIDGNIASGKTTVLTEIQKKGYPVYFEPFEDNPWLPLYYKDPKTYSLNTQLWFLSERYRQYKKADFHSDGIVFVERSMYTDRFIFVELIRRQGNLNDLEYNTYKHHFNIYKNPLPDLTIVLNTSAKMCKERMDGRARDMESTVPLDYLQQLGEVYSENYDKLGVKSIKKYFPFDPEQTSDIIINQAIHHYKDYEGIV